MKIDPDKIRTWFKGHSEQQPVGLLMSCFAAYLIKAGVKPKLIENCLLLAIHDVAKLLPEEQAKELALGIAEIVDDSELEV